MATADAHFSNVALIDAAGLERTTGGWWEPASTYDPNQRRYVATEQYKETYDVDRVCRRASC